MEQSQARGDEEDAAPDLEGVAGGEIFENNHSIGSEILESMFGVYEVFGNPRPERSLENLVYRVDLIVPATMWASVIKQEDPSRRSSEASSAT